MVLNDYLRIITKRLWLILLGALAGGLLGLLASSYLGYLPTYTATSTVIVGGDVQAVEENQTYTQLGQQFLGTYVDLVTRDIVLQSVIDDLGLTVSPNLLGEIITAELIDDTQLIEITVRHQDPMTAAAIANAAADQVISLPSIRVRDFVILVEEAEVPTALDSIWILPTIIAATLGALLVGGLVFIAEFLRDPVYSAEELGRRSGIPVLATIRATRYPSERGSGSMPRWRNVSQAAWWPLMEACRHRFGKQPGPQNPQSVGPRVLIASPTNGQETGIVAANLAYTWAKSGQDVVLVDADVHAPSLHEWFDQPQGPGLREVLSGSYSPEGTEDVLHSTEISGLSLLPAGNNGHTPGDPMLPDVLDQIFSNLARSKDAIIIKGPPLVSTSEGVMIATRSDGVLLVLSIGRTTMSATRDAQDALALVNIEPWGAILAEHPRRSLPSLRGRFSLPQQPFGIVASSLWRSIDAGVSVELEPSVLGSSIESRADTKSPEQNWTSGAPGEAEGGRGFSSEGLGRSIETRSTRTIFDDPVDVGTIARLAHLWP